VWESDHNIAVVQWDLRLMWAGALKARKCSGAEECSTSSTGQKIKRRCRSRNDHGAQVRAREPAASTRGVFCYCLVGPDDLLASLSGPWFRAATDSDSVGREN
jgi:hypothetical protein